MARMSKDGINFFDVDDSEESLSAAKAKGYKEYVPMTKNGTDVYDVEFTEDSYKAAIAKGYQDVDAYNFTKNIKSTTAGQAAVKGVISGLAQGFDDELGGALEAVGSKVGLRGVGSSDLTDIRFETDEEDSESFGDVYRSRRDQRRADKATAEKEHSGAYLAGDIFGGVVSGVAGPAGTSIKGAAGLGAIQGLGRSRADLTDPSLENYGESVMDTAEGAAAGLVGLGVGKGLEKGLPLVKRLIPGTEKAVPLVNKATAKAAKLIPSQNASEDEILRVLTEVAERRNARTTDFSSKAIDLAEQLEAAKRAMSKDVSQRFNELEAASLKATDGAMGWDDFAAANEMAVDLAKQKKFLDENAQFFGRTPKKLVEDVNEIIKSGGPKEAGSPTYQLTFKEIVDRVKEDIGPDAVLNHFAKNKTDIGIEEAGKAMRLRSLYARRYIDDVMKSKNWDNLLTNEKEEIVKLRDIVDSRLKGLFGGGQERQIADELYAKSKLHMNELFKPLEQLDANGLRNVNPQKLNNFLKSQGVKGSVFDKRIESFGRYLEEATEQLKKMPEGVSALEALDEARKLGGLQRLLDDMNRTAGGPSSQALNTLVQIGGAMSTGGWSLLLLPITNPRGWVEIVDSVGKPLWDSISKASKAFMTKNPGLASRLYLLSKEWEDQNEQ